MTDRPIVGEEVQPRTLPAAHGTHRLLALTGFMGSGKSTVARLLARQIGWRHVDLDTRVVECAGHTIPDFFARFGEPAFREVEHQELARVLGEALEHAKQTVISLGGGTSAQASNIAALKQSACPQVWLHCPIEHLISRCARITDRPLFRDEVSFRKLYEVRRPFYEMAEYRVEAATEPLRVVEQILALNILERISL